MRVNLATDSKKLDIGILSKTTVFDKAQYTAVAQLGFSMFLSMHNSVDAVGYRTVQKTSLSFACVEHRSLSTTPILSLGTPRLDYGLLKETYLVKYTMISHSLP